MQYVFSFGNKKRYNLTRLEAIRLGVRYKSFLRYKKQTIKNNIKEGIGACLFYSVLFFCIFYCFYLIKWILHLHFVFLVLYYRHNNKNESNLIFFNFFNGRLGCKNIFYT